PFHVVADALNEAGGRLGILVGTSGSRHRSRFFIPTPVVRRTRDPVSMKESHVEPDRRVERPKLVEAKRGQLVIKSLGISRRRKITVLLAPISDSAGDSINQLTY